MDSNLNAIAEVTVYRLALSFPDSYTILVPEPEASWYAIAVDGAEVLPFEN